MLALKLALEFYDVIAYIHVKFERSKQATYFSALVDTRLEVSL